MGNELERVLGEANRLALRDCEYVQEVRAEMVQGEMNALRQEVDEADRLNSGRPGTRPRQPFRPQSARSGSRPQSGHKRPGQQWNQRGANTSVGGLSGRVSGSGSVAARSRLRADPPRESNLDPSYQHSRLGSSIRSAYQALEVPLDVYTFSMDSPSKTLQGQPISPAAMANSSGSPDRRYYEAA